ncbi:MAG: aldo/keto reductase [Thermodesulfobacteriota bacterium]
MEKRTLGKTGLAVTALGFGALRLQYVTEHDAAQMLNTVLDGGINFIDTAPDYGLSETFIGKAISHRRSEFYLATKCGCNIDAAGKQLVPAHIWTRRHLLTNLENSLRLLKTDYVDVWQLHSIRPEDLAGGKNDEVIQTMIDMKQQGKVRFIGVSLRNGKPYNELYPAAYAFMHAPNFIAWDICDVMQIVYGGLVRLNETVITQAAQKGIGTIIRGTVRKYRENYDALFAKAALGELCGKDESRDGFLIRFALAHPDISTIIVGTQNPEHLRTNLQVAQKGALPADIYQEAKRRLGDIGIGPDK